MSMTPERKLNKTTVSLMRSPLFADWSGILMLGKKYVVDNIPTAATDGWNEWYGRKFIETMTDKMLAFAVLHEAGHKLYRHLTVWRKLFDLDPECANRAADHMLNLMIIERDPQNTMVELPKIDGKVFVCYDHRFKGMSTKEIFDILREEKKGRGRGPGKKPGEQGDEPGEGGGSGEDGETFDHHDWKGAKEYSKEEREQIAKDIDQAVRQGQITAQKIAGRGAGNMNRELADLLDPKIDWKEVMREFISTHCRGRDKSSWRRLNRRFVGQDICLPTMIGERVPCVAIGSDTSGSIDQATLSRGISEVAALMEDVTPEELHMIYWDSRVAGHEKYDDSNRSSFVSTTKPKGGGGTDPTSMMHYLKDEKIKPDCIIQFTDGCISDWGNEWDAPVLWVIIGSWGAGNFAPVGKTVHLDD